MKIQIGETYLFDILNQLNIKENGTYSVQIIAKKNRFLRKPLYRVISLQTKEAFWVASNFLFPIPKDARDIIVTRYPEDIPTINDSDIEVINRIILDYENGQNNPTSQKLDNNTYYHALCKLRVKLVYYSKVRDI